MPRQIVVSFCNACDKPYHRLVLYLFPLPALLARSISYIFASAQELPTACFLCCSTTGRLPVFPQESALAAAFFPELEDSIRPVRGFETAAVALFRILSSIRPQITHTTAWIFFPYRAIARQSRSTDIPGSISGPACARKVPAIQTLDGDLRSPVLTAIHDSKCRSRFPSHHLLVLPSPSSSYSIFECS